MMEQKSGDPNVMSEFKQKKTRQLLAAIPAVLAIVPLVIAEDVGPNGLWGIPIIVLAPICLVVILGVLVFSLINWRCPGCKGYLGKKISPRFCSKCGIQLQP
jgi:hypothetical protein